MEIFFGLTEHLTEPSDASRISFCGLGGLKRARVHIRYGVGSGRGGIGKTGSENPRSLSYSGWVIANLHYQDSAAMNEYHLKSMSASASAFYPLREHSKLQ